MTTEEFWEKYTNEDILEIFDLACDFFTEELPQEFIDNYDVGEVILETRGHQEDEKNFDNVLKFTKILQKHQPSLYKEFFQYFDGFLVDYFWFYSDSLKVKKSFLNFLENPLQDYDIYLRSFKKLMFYQHSELLDQAISKNYSTVSQSDALIFNAEYDLAICKFYILLQKICFEGDKNFDKTKFSKKIAEYDFEFYDEFFSSLETGMLKQQKDPDELKKMFTKNKKRFFVVVQGYFLRYMYEKGFEFYLSGKIWDNMMIYWKENNKKNNTKQYFNIKSSSFEKYLAGVAGDFIFDNTSEMIAILWGSVYVYDFLHKDNLISEQHFNDFIEISQELKGKVIGQYTPDLWNSNFVHHWDKPDCISETEFVEENNIFQKSINFKHKPFTRLRSHIAEELAKIGELSKFIIEGGKNDTNNDDTSLLDDLFNLPLNDIEESDNDLFNPPLNEIEESDNDSRTSEPNHRRTSEPIRVEKKVGRNDPCPCGSGKKYKKCCGKK